MIYIALSDNDEDSFSSVMGVFPSLEEMAKHVDNWIQKSPNRNLHFQEWEMGKVESRCWGWVYINPDRSIKDFGCDYRPHRKNFGKNLLAMEKYECACWNDSDEEPHDVMVDDTGYCQECLDNPNLQRG